MSSKSLNWLLVGTGEIARKRVAPALQMGDSNLLAVCSAHLDGAARFAAVNGVAGVYDNFDRALDHPSVDAVYIATPVGLHAQQAIQAMDSGKHVLVEKPLALNKEEALSVALKAQQTKLVAGCAFYRRCFPSYRYAQQMLSDGEFGQIIMVRTAYCSWFAPSPEDPKYWRVIRSQSGGGPLADMGSHMLDLLIGLFGFPTAAFGYVTTLVQPYEVEDTAAFVLTLSSGAQAFGNFHWNSKTWVHELEIVGSHAKLKWPAVDAGTVIKTVARQSTEISLSNHPNVHVPLIEDFVEAVRQKHAPVVSVAEAAKTNEALDAIYASAKSGQIIRF